MNKIKSSWQDRVISDCLFTHFESISENVLIAHLEIDVVITKLAIGYELKRGEQIIHCLEEPDVCCDIQLISNVESATAPTVKGLLNVLETLGYHDVVEQFEDQEYPELREGGDMEDRHGNADCFVEKILADTEVGNWYKKQLVGAWYA